MWQLWNRHVATKEEVRGNYGTGTWQLGNRYVATREQVRGN